MMEQEKNIKWRQKFHLEPPDGWMNDPNGLSYFGGEYHVYFQYSPKDPNGKTPRGWGHYHGKDLFHMSYDREVLTPGIPEDRNGVYSGSGVENDGKLHLFYTGNVKLIGDYNYITNGREANVIYVNTEDGSNMSEKQVLLRNEDYPDFCSCHVRDPKVWKDGDVWKMVLGARNKQDEGCVLLYQSKNLTNWEYETCISKKEFGFMWECPDYFQIDGKGFLSVSPQGLPHYETKWQNLYQSGYFPVIGALEENRLGEFTEWDMGFDFYAPQTFEDAKGRRILFAWFGMDYQAYGNATIDLGWQHCLTLPRELTVDENGVLHQYPISELEQLRKEVTHYKEGEEKETPVPFDLEAKVEKSFQISIDHSLYICYDKEKKLMTMEFTNQDYGCGRTIRKAKLEDCTKLRMVADRSSIEVYFNDGSMVASTRFYPKEERVRLRLEGIEADVWEF